MSKKAKDLKITERKIYKPEFKSCPKCGGWLQLQGHYQWRKTVQHLDRVVYVASQAGTCENSGCDQAKKTVLCAAAPSGNSIGLHLWARHHYGLDIIAQVGWWRDREHLTRQEAHQRLIEKGVQSSEREVDNLYTHYQVLLACTHSGKHSALEQAVKERGGLIVGLDGLWHPKGPASNCGSCEKCRQTRFWSQPGWSG